MDIAGGIVAYVVIWWVVFFAALPFGVRTSEQPERGHDSGAPENPRLLRKALVTTGVAAVLWLVLDQVIRSEFISLGGSAY